jgi:RNA-directed DNA polymerase
LALWGLYVQVCKPETLQAAYRLARENDGAPGSDGVTFEAIEAQGLEGFLGELREELVQRTYRPLRVRKVEIPKAGGTRQLSIPATRGNAGYERRWKNGCARNWPSLRWR